MTATDFYSEWDAAYVLGALDPRQRREFEEHLVTCAVCQTAVAELAGTPGLLAQVPPGEVLAMDHAGLEELEEPPVSLMPSLPAEPRRRVESPRRRWLVLAVAAASALVLGGLAGYAAHAGLAGETPEATTTVTQVPTASGRLAFSAVVPASMTAVLDVVPQGAKTLLKVECQYAVGSEKPGDPDYQGAWADYSIWVVPKSGQPTQIKQWTARPDKVMHPSGVSPLPVKDIKSVEIRRVDSGDTVMRADLA